MKLLKYSFTMLLAIGMMTLVLTACGSKEETNKETEETPAVTDTASTEDTTTTDDVSGEEATVTEDENAAKYVGEYVRTGEVGEVTFVVSEDGSFEMTVTGEVNQVVSGLYKFGITDSESVIKLLLYPNKNIVDGEEEVVENVEGTAIIEGDTLTLTMESEDTVFNRVD